MSARHKRLLLPVLGLLAFLGAGLLPCAFNFADAAPSTTQGVKVDVATQVSWGSAGGCVQNIQTDDFGALTPSPSSVLLGSFGALPTVGASTDSHGNKVWVGCVTSNTGLASVTAQGSRSMSDGHGELALSDVAIGATNSPPGGQCDITAGQGGAGSCSLPVAGATLRTLIENAPAGTNELDWQYQLALPANQPLGSYSGGQVTFTATAGEDTEHSQPSGSITEYTLAAGSEPRDIAAGADGNLWYVDYATGKIGKITTAGSVTEYSLPTGSEPTSITSGPEGNLWYATYNDQSSNGKIGKITTSGTITEYAIAKGSFPLGITVGPDGNLWYTNTITNAGGTRIGRITPSGAFIEYKLPSGSNPYGITAGSDGNL
ncbi:MAG TPA: hypothetical protein VID48_10775, partial [Solirubrobacteraceae bacterium]